MEQLYTKNTHISHPGEVSIDLEIPELDKKGCT